MLPGDPEVCDPEELTLLRPKRQRVLSIRSPHRYPGAPLIASHDLDVMRQSLMHTPTDQNWLHWPVSPEEASQIDENRAN